MPKPAVGSWPLQQDRENDPLFSVEYEVIEREAGNRAAATDAMSALGRLLPVAEINL